MNNRLRLVYKLTPVNKRIYLMWKTDKKIYIDGYIKKTQKKTPSFRKEAKRYATKRTN